MEVSIFESRAQGQDSQVRSRGACLLGTGLMLTIAVSVLSSACGHWLKTQA